jgi:hypothetical protein
MAIYNKLLQPLSGYMGPVNQQTPINPPVVDDFFDPLFNKEVVEYNKALYGNRLLGILSAYGDMYENALTGEDGILGPGMGILSTFGRTMDKADDFILGGLTEGVNAVGHVLGGSNPKATNPIRNIFVLDRDYEGSDLMAAAGNAMAKLAGGNVQLGREDFSSLGDRAQSMVINLATDPGFMGGRVAAANPANRVAAALDSYDSAMAKLAGNTALPGGQYFAKKSLAALKRAVGGASYKDIQDVIIQGGPEAEFYKNEVNKIANMVDPASDPELAKAVQIAELPNTVKKNDLSKLATDNAEKAKALHDESLKQHKDALDAAKADKDVASKTPETFDEALSNVASAFNAEDRAILDSYDDAGKLVKRGWLNEHLETPLKYSAHPEGKSLVDTGIYTENTYIDNALEDYMKKSIQTAKDELQIKIDSLDDKSKASQYEYRPSDDAVIKEYVYYGDPNQPLMLHNVPITVKPFNANAEAFNAAYIGNHSYDMETANRVTQNTNSKTAAEMSEDVYDASYIDSNVSNIKHRYSRPIYHLTSSQYYKMDVAKKQITDAIDANNSEFLKAKGFAADEIAKSDDPTKFIDTMRTEVSKIMRGESADHSVAFPKDTILGSMDRAIDDFKTHRTYKSDNVQKLFSDTKRIAAIIQNPKFQSYFLNEGEGSKYVANSMLEPFVEWAERVSKLSDVVQTENKILTQSVNNVLRIPDDLNIWDWRELEKDLPYTYNIQATRPIDVDLAMLDKKAKLKGNESLNSARLAIILKPYYDKASPELLKEYGNVDGGEKYVKNVFAVPKDKLLGEGLGVKSGIRNRLRIFNRDTNEWELLKYDKKTKLLSIPDSAVKDGEVLMTYKYRKDLNGNPLDNMLQHIYVKSDGTVQVMGNSLKLFSARKADTEKVSDVLNAHFSESIAKNTLPAPATVEYSAKDMDAQTVESLTTPNLAASNVAQQEITKAAVGDLAEGFGVPVENPEDLTKLVKTHGTKRQKTLYMYTNALVSGKSNASKGISGYGFSGNKDVKTLCDVGARIDKDYDAATRTEFGNWFQRNEDQIVTAENFSLYPLRSGGYVLSCYKDGNAAEMSSALASLKRNVDTVNKAAGANVFKVVRTYMPTKKATVIGYAIDTSNANWRKNLNKLFKQKSVNLEDVVFMRGRHEAVPERFRELYDYYGNVAATSKQLAYKYGFTDYSDTYMRHALSDNAEDVDVFGEIKNAAGINDKDLTDAVNAANNLDALSGVNTRAFGMNVYERSFLGDPTVYENGFSNSAEFIAKSTFTKGSFDNVNANTVQEIFFNGNYSVKNNFDSVDSLRNALRIKDAQGNYYGNLDNLVLIEPKFNSEGRIVGFNRLNAFSDDALKYAMEHDSVVLAPNAVVGKYDRLLKKEAKMSSKAYRFLNKYFTLPFKFGVLANPGFLVGNMEDAAFKQAETLSRKYGTTIEEEVANVGMAYRTTMQLKNEFGDVFDNYVKTMQDDNALKAITSDYKTVFKRSRTAAKNGLLSTDLLMNNPEYFKEWTTFLNGHNPLTAQQQKLARMYTFISNYMSSGTFKNNNLEMEDLLDATRQNKYDTPNNIVDRVLYGKPGKGYSTWGIITHNPVSDSVLEHSNNFEEFTRFANVVNELQHKGWTPEKMASVLNVSGAAERKMFERLQTDTLNAINVMHASNFDYDNVSDFMDKLSYAVPFPTFYLKNLAHWMEVFADHPEMVDDIISAHEAMWQSKDTKNDEFAAEAKGRGAIPLQGKSKLLTGIAKQSPTNSMFSAFNAINNAKEDLAYRTHPALRPITRHLQDPKDVKYRPYSMDPYEKNIRKGDKQFSELSYMFHQMNPYDRFMQTYLRTPRKVATNDYQASDFLPSMFQPDFGKKR